MSPRVTKVQREAAQREAAEARFKRFTAALAKSKKHGDAVRRSQLFFSGVIVPREGPDAEEGGDEWQVVEDRTEEGGRREPQA